MNRGTIRQQDHNTPNSIQFGVYRSPPGGTEGGGDGEMQTDRCRCDEEKTLNRSDNSNELKVRSAIFPPLSLCEHVCVCVWNQKRCELALTHQSPPACLACCKTGSISS
ncbi:uncharacterized protein V6R79_014023 [Siganus canaliculatus]